VTPYNLDFKVTVLFNENRSRKWYRTTVTMADW